MKLENVVASHERSYGIPQISQNDLGNEWPQLNVKLIKWIAFFSPLSFQMQEPVCF